MHLWDPCTTIRHKTNQMNVWGMRAAPILQPNSCLLRQLCCQRSTLSDHREGQLQGSVIWHTKPWTKKKGLNSAWHWFLPHPAWNHKSKSMQTQAATAITYCSHWLEFVFSRHFSFTGSASKITVGSGKTPLLATLIWTMPCISATDLNMQCRKRLIVSHYIYVCSSVSVLLLSMHMAFSSVSTMSNWETLCNIPVSPRNWDK